MSDDEELRPLDRELAGDDIRDAARAVLEPGAQLRALTEIGLAYGDEGPVAILDRMIGGRVCAGPRDLLRHPPARSAELIAALGGGEVRT